MQQHQQDIDLENLEQEKELDTPIDYICPIIQELMRDPVITADGHSYERAAIEEWLRDHNTSPVTGLVLDNTNLITNVRLKAIIDDFRTSHSSDHIKPDGHI